jgi:hypothetical protein
MAPPEPHRPYRSHCPSRSRSFSRRSRDLQYHGGLSMAHPLPQYHGGLPNPHRPSRSRSRSLPGGIRHFTPRLARGARPLYRTHLLCQPNHRYGELGTSRRASAASTPGANAPPTASSPATANSHPTANAPPTANGPATANSAHTTNSAHTINSLPAANPAPTADPAPTAGAHPLCTAELWNVCAAGPGHVRTPKRGDVRESKRGHG